MEDAEFLIAFGLYVASFILGFQRRLRVTRVGLWLLALRPWVLYVAISVRDGCFTPEYDICMFG